MENLESHKNYTDNDEYNVRLNKLESLKEMGVNPYPYAYNPSSSAGKLAKKYCSHPIGSSEEAQDGETEEVCVAGRVVLFRAMGKNAFGHIQDHDGRIQLMLNRDKTKIEGLKSSEISGVKWVEKFIDLGDIIGVQGHLFRTKKGEITIFAKNITLLTKTLLPLPDKYSGLQDKGVRYRKRWLDLITNPGIKNTFVQRSKIYNLIRRYYADHHFMEVETPILQNTYGGAEARPFTTDLHALHQKMFARISLEIPLKKLIVGGFDRVFEIGKVFRNEGIDKTHNPEFTELESYAAYWDYNDVMKFTEELFEFIAKELFGTTILKGCLDKKGNEREINLQAPWKKISMKDSIKEYAGYDLDELSVNQQKKILKEETSIDFSEIEKATSGNLMSFFFEEFVEHHLIQPHHIIDHPIETTPLCKNHRTQGAHIVERFESFILGFEFCNAYSELNDPVLQRELLVKQAKILETDEEKGHPLDEEFLESIAQGMPPCGGVGIGLDRLVMLFTKQSSIRDVLFFPIMRPQD